MEAWKRIKVNKGSSGIDDISIEDIEKCFNNVNQDKLMGLVEQRISDIRILKLAGNVSIYEKGLRRMSA